MYPMLTKENKFLGLEAMDFLALLIVYLVVFLCSNNLFLNAALLAAAYLFLRVYKKNKAPHYTKNILRFFMLPNRFTLNREVS